MTCNMENIGSCGHNFQVFSLHFLSDLQPNISRKLNIFTAAALESEAAVGVRIDVLFEGNNWSSLRKSLTFRIYTYNLQPNLGLKSSFSLTSVKVFCRCLFTCRVTVVLLLRENKSTLSQVRSLELWLKHAIQFKWNGIRNSWLPWIMCLHFTSLLPHKNTISICTVRLNDTI